MAYNNDNNSSLLPSSSSSAVLINNIDDYLAPSQACVNPLYTGSQEGTETNRNSQPAEQAPVIVPRVRRPRRRQAPSPADDGDLSSLPPIVPASVTKQDPVKASIADCLACSGCVTTAETVLLEQNHSLEALRQVLHGNNNSKVVVATISPAVWADLLRHLKVDQQFQEVYQRKLVTCLQRVLNVSYVLDGNLPLQWSLLASAEEFCQAYRQAHGVNHGSNGAIINHDNNNFNTNNMTAITQQLDEKQTPSMALSATKTQYWLPNGDTHIVDIDAQSLMSAQLPILTSSCPALVCLVEKSTHGAVKHLSKVKSPMSMAGAWWSRLSTKTNTIDKSRNLFHLAIMPCHDKKLEASRKDFIQENGAMQKADVDLVITTQEWFQMIVEHVEKLESDMTDGVVMSDQGASGAVHKVRNYLESLPPAGIAKQPILTLDGTAGLSSLANGEGATLLLAGRVGSDNRNELEDVMDVEDAAAMDMDMEDGAIMSSASSAVSGHCTVNNTRNNSNGDQSQNSFFPYGSGGLADFVFRYAALHLFQCQISEVPWKPVQDAQQQQRQIVSARMQRRAAATRRDYYEAILYRHGSDRTYSCEPRDSSSIPVLRFATAYGLQTVQRALVPFSGEKSNTDTTLSSDITYLYDFVEAMACPSGCLNGGGQLRVADRETPTLTRHRVAETQHRFTTLPRLETNGAIQSSNASLPPDPLLLHTRFHVVPPLAHALGAAAGVAVKDTQW